MRWRYDLCINDTRDPNLPTEAPGNLFKLLNLILFDIVKCIFNLIFVLYFIVRLHLTIKITNYILDYNLFTNNNLNKIYN